MKSFRFFGSLMCLLSLLGFILTARAELGTPPRAPEMTRMYENTKVQDAPRETERKTQNFSQTSMMQRLSSASVPKGTPVDGGEHRKIEIFLNKLRACLNMQENQNTKLTLGILGVEEDETRISAEDSLILRRKVQKILTGWPDVRLKAAAEMDDILERLQAEGRFSQEKIQAELSKAQDVDALVYIEVRQVKIRKGYRIVNYDLRGLTRTDACMVVMPAPMTSRLRTEQVHDFATLAKNRLRYLLNKHREIQELIFRQFKVNSSYATDCSRALPKRLVELVEEIEGTTPWITRGRSLRKRIVAPRAQPEDDVRERIFVVGELRSISGVSKEQAMRLDITFMRGGLGGEILGTLRARVSNLDCNVASENFETRILAAARLDTALFKVTAPQTSVQRGSAVVFDIWSRKNVHVRCMVIDLNDYSAYILFPSPSTNSDYMLEANETRRYPEGFGFDSQFYENDSNNLFGCFATAKPLSGNARALWDALSGRPDPLLKSSEINSLLEELRAVEGIVEHWVKVVVARRS